MTAPRPALAAENFLQIVRTGVFLDIFAAFFLPKLVLSGFTDAPQVVIPSGSILSTTAIPTATMRVDRTFSEELL